MKKLNIALFIFLAVAIVVSLGFIVLLNVTPQKVNKFTEFYVLNAEGQAEDYPNQATVGSPVDLVIGVVNHEYQPASYQVSVEIDGAKVGQVDVGTLAYQQKWEEKVSFTPQVIGENQTVDFFLYKDSGTEPYQKDPLVLHLNVVSR